MAVRPFFSPEPGRRARVAFFMSGSGSNARVLLERAAAADSPFEAAVIATDAPEQSNARLLADEFGVPMVSLDIRKFYAGYGESSIRLDSPERRRVRDLWSDELWRLVSRYSPDFGVLAGFVPLSNITANLCCINVHPGDLTVEENGVRIFAGLHVKPVESVILRDIGYLRSSVILAQSYRGSGKADMDSGPVLGVSEKVPVELSGFEVAALQKCADGREAGRVADDDLRHVALHNIEILKKRGDHVVFPPVVEHFACGDFGYDDDGYLMFKDSSGTWLRVETVEFGAGGSETPWPAE